jgi:phosphopantothenoylcysteine decarboxylase/phosphopantothenate--cysteine ligase
MWVNPITQYNLAKLSALGHEVIQPDEGELATRHIGPGRFPEVETIVEYVVEFFSRVSDFSGLRVLITAGPTYEFIDPVRFIGNPSTGAMGYALAEAAAKRGAEVGLISGPSQLDAPAVFDFAEVVTTEQLAEEVLSRIDDYDILIMAAAPSDYAPKEAQEHKIKKSAKPISIELEPTVDILKRVAEAKRRPSVIGFALETESEIENARKKMADKKLDMIVVNNPTVTGAGFGTETNRVTIISGKKRPKKLPLMSKRELSHEILNAILKIR